MSTLWLDQINWNADGLVPVITQEAKTLKVLTHAWLNRDALEASATESRAVYWSRSRQKLWRKGEQSGYIQKIVDIYLDCDSDTVRFKVEQTGGIACHTGRESCFYLKLSSGSWIEAEPVLRDPREIYRSAENTKNE